jgi:hypothetical protein
MTWKMYYAVTTYTMEMNSDDKINIFNNHDNNVPKLYLKFEWSRSSPTAIALPYILQIG